jgi:peptidyl-prolyl cis-trans isomerase SurA
MNRPTRRGFHRLAGLAAVWGALALAAPPAVGQSLTSGRPGAIVLERVIVKINGDPFTQTDLEEAQIAQLRTRGVIAQTDAELLQIVQEMTPAVLAEAVDALLMIQRGRAYGFRLSDEQFEEILTSIKTDNNLDDEQLAIAIQEDQGLTMDGFRQAVEDQMMVGQVQQEEILGKISMTDTEARVYYEDNLDEFMQPATVSLREILVAAAQGGDALAEAQDRAALARAEEARARVLAGEDFAEVAKEMSDAPSKDNGGLIGPIDRNDLAEAIAARLATMTVGEVGAVERTQAGYQILQFADDTAAAPTPYDDVRNDIMQNVFDERRLQALERFLGTLRTAAIVEWVDENLQAVYEAEVAARNDGRGGA